MMYQDSFVRCPFYKETPHRDVIMCEGVEDKMVIEHRFMYRSEEKKQMKKADYMKRFCCNHYENCPVGKMLMKKYGD